MAATGDQNLKLVNSELYQSIGPFFIVTLTPLLVGLLSCTSEKGKGAWHSPPNSASPFSSPAFLPW